MESDLSLIEIAREDDSLLQQIPNDDILNLKPNHHHNDYFLCSPFYVPKTKRIEDVVKNEDIEKGNCTSGTDSVNKDNFSANKAEGPKLGIDRHQMKRKKGGYNLRKSLAWDRAFFTDEGVLNSEELSLISGSLSNSNGEALSVIHEEGSSGSSSSPYLHAIEENLFKELPATTLNNGKNSPSSKHASPSSPVMVARRKVLSAQDISRNGSKRSSCPRPVTSSSLKRPATLNATKALKNAREGDTARVSKLSAPKPEPSAASRTVKNATSNAVDPKQNQITHFVNNKKNAGLKVSSNNMKNVVNKSKSGPAGKSLTTKTSNRQSKRTVVRGSSLQGGSDKCCPSSLQFLSTNETNRGSRVISNPSLSSTVNASSYHDEGSRKTVALHQNARTSGTNMQHVQLQPAKPSGLRMPSPSLGFFSQSKVSPTHSSSKSSQPCNLCESNTPTLSKIGSLRTVQYLRPPLAPGRIKNADNDKETLGKIKLSGSNSGVSISSSVNPDFNEKVDEVSEVTCMEKVQQLLEQKLHPNDVVMNQQLLEQREESCITETNSQMDEKGMQSEQKNFLLFPEKSDKYYMHKKFAEVSSKDTDKSELENPHLAFSSSSEMKVTACLGKNDVIDQQLLQCKPSNQSSKEPGVILDNNVADVFSDVIQGTPKVHDDSLSELQSVDKQFLEQAELHPTREVDLISGESQMLVKEGDLLKNFVCPEERNNCICEVVAETILKILDCNETKTEKPHIVSILENQENCDLTAIDGTGINTLVEDATKQSLDGNTKIDSRGSNSSFSVDNQQLMVVDNVNEGAEKMESLDGTGINTLVEDATEQSLDGNTEIDSRSSNSSFSVDNQHLMIADKMESLGANLVKREAFQDLLIDGNNFFPEKQEQNNVHQFVESPEHEITADCGSEPKSFAAPCQAVVAMTDCESGGGQYLKDSPAVSVVCEPVLENSNLNTLVQPNIEKQCEATALKMEIMEEDQVTSFICAQDLLVTYPKSGCCCESGLETSSFASDISLDKKIEISTDVRNPIELENVENNELSLSVENSLSNFTSHPEVDGLCHENISMEKIHMVEVQLSVNAQQIEQCELRMSCSSGKEKVSHKEKHRPQAIENIQSLEKFENLSYENRTDLHSEDAGFCTLEDFRGSFSHRYSCGAFQKVDINNEPLLDGFMQFMSDNFVDSAIGNVLSNQYLVVHDDTNQKAGYDHQNQDKRTEEISMDLDPSFCMNDTLLTEKLDKNVNESDCNHDKKTEEVTMVHDPSFCTNDTLPTEGLEINVNGSDFKKDKRTEELSMDNVPSFCMNDTLLTQELEKNAGGSDFSQDKRTEEVSMDHDPSFCINDTLFTEELETNVNESVFKLSDSCGCEPKSSYSFTQVEHPKQEGGFDVSRKYEHLLNEDVVTDSTEIEASTENLQHHTEFEPEMKLTNQAISLEPDFVAKISNNQISGDSSIKAMYSLDEESMSSALGDETRPSSRKLLVSDKPLEPLNVLLHDNHELKNDVTHETKSPLPAEDNKAQVEIKKSVNNRKEDPLAIKPPPNVDPFSDEWLAAFESAGEEILTMKSGAVQNSPQDKVQIELGPWSPVKRKTNQGIGPFDCTKYTNTQVPPD